MDANGNSSTGMTLPPKIVVELKEAPRSWFSWIFKLLPSLVTLFVLLTVLSLIANPDRAGISGPHESLHSGKESAKEKIALVNLDGTIMPPFTERFLQRLKRIEKDESVKGVVLVIDSPGGLVTDSHEIYTALQKLQKKRNLKMYVSMKRIAASGGLYAAMGVGPSGTIFAEETTWTGSIGVIIPRYDVSKLASDHGVKVEPLVTGKFKDSLSPFKELTAEERVVWEEIIKDAFDRFIHVIDEGRGEKLNEEQIRKLATGQIYTAKQAKENGLVDEILSEDDVIERIKTDLSLPNAKVVTYEFPPTLSERLLGSIRAPEVNPWQALLESSVPRAMYFCGWHTSIGGETAK